MAAKRPAKKAIACMSASYEEPITSRLGWDIPALSSPKIQATQIWDTTVCSQRLQRSIRAPGRLTLSLNAGGVDSGN